MNKYSCYLCKKSFNEFERIPKILPICGHTYCLSCIHENYSEENCGFSCVIDGLIIEGTQEEMNSLPTN